MIRSFIRYLRGYVKIRVEGYSPERFLNLCRARNIEIWELKSSGLSYEMNVSIRDFRKLKPLRKKARAHVEILERHGLPFFLSRNRSRKMFQAGILLCACTDYERAGVNPRPFNEPRNWEINPYGPNMFQN